MIDFFDIKSNLDVITRMRSIEDGFHKHAWLCNGVPWSQGSHKNGLPINNWQFFDKYGTVKHEELFIK